MRVGVIGRTNLLLRAVEDLVRQGHEITFIQTGRGESHYGAGEEDFAKLARELGAPYFCRGRLEANLCGGLAARSDVAISVNWPTLIGAPIREAFTHGVLNAHAGDLPRYQGNACPNWAILNFADYVCLTVHRMTDELDFGPYLVKAYRAIGEETYIGDIYDWLEAITPSLFVQAIDRLQTAGFIELDPTVRPSRMFPRRPEDSRIVWAAPTCNVLALIRASSTPFPGAFTDLEGTERVHILRARRFRPDYDFCAVPGQVCVRVGGNPVVATSDGMIEIEECSADGLDPQEAKALIGRSLRNRLF